MFHVETIYKATKSIEDVGHPHGLPGHCPSEWLQRSALALDALGGDHGQMAGGSNGKVEEIRGKEGGFHWENCGFHEENCGFHEENGGFMVINLDSSMQSSQIVVFEKVYQTNGYV